MPQLDIVAADGTKTGDSLKLSDKIFNTSKSPVVVREALNQYLANQRQGTASTKTRGLVSGGGSKPWRQKGTGRSRHGSIRSPIWRHGGTTFGPQPRDYSYSLPKTKKRVALYTVLTAKLQEQQIKLVKDIPVNEPKTKAMKQFIAGLGLNEQKTLIVLEKAQKHIYLAGRNIPGVKVSVAENINIYDLLYYDTIVFTPDSLKRLEELIG